MRIRFEAVLVIGAVTVAANAAAAPDDVDAIEYTVEQGDTCAAIAKKFYGDAKRLDLVHRLNGWLGPPPHHLKPGDVLRLPRENGPPSGPDATLTRVRNVVEVSAPDPRPAKRDDPLFRGNRVGTKESSAAEVTFRDETQARLGENTLVVILGDANAATRTLAMGAGGDAVLVTGDLRARLGELAGKKPKIETPAALVAMNGGEAKVSVDPQKTTRVAVYRGTSTITAQKRAVDVADGFGSKAEKSREPSAPRPLPPAPVWSSPPPALALVDGAAPAEVTATYEGGTGPGLPAAQWHVQVARDADFGDVVVDAKVPVVTTRLVARALATGAYVARVSAIDADQFEGKWSPVAKFEVASVTLRPRGKRRANVEVSPNDVTCRESGVPASDLDRLRAHELLCLSSDGATAHWTAPALPFPKVRALADTLWKRDRRGVLRVRVTDEDGDPVEDLAVAARRTCGADVGRFVPAPGERGAYTAPIAWRPSVASCAFSLELDGGRGVDTNVVTLEPPPPPESPRGVELVAAAGMGFRNGEQIGGTGALGFDYVFPSLVGGADSVGLRGVFETYVPKVVAVDEPGGAEAREHAGVLTFGARLPLAHRFARRAAPVAFYVAAGPEVTRTTLNVDAGQTHAWKLGGYAGVGVDGRVGRAFSAFWEVGGKLAWPIDEQRPDVAPAALMTSLGLRVRP